RAIPGVESAGDGDSTSLPMGDRHFQLAFLVEGKTEDTQAAPVAEICTASAGYFETLRIPVIRGRAFAESDNSTVPPEIVVNETLARRYWANGEAVGQHIRFAAQRRDGQPTPWITIVGVVADVKSEGLDTAPAPRIYRPMYQGPTYDGVIYARTALDPGT